MCLLTATIILTQYLVAVSGAPFIWKALENTIQDSKYECKKDVDCKNNEFGKSCARIEHRAYDFGSFDNFYNSTLMNYKCVPDEWVKDFDTNNCLADGKVLNEREKSS